MDLFLFKNIKKSVFILHADMTPDMVGAIMRRHMATYVHATCAHVHAHACVCVCACVCECN